MSCKPHAVCLSMSITPCKGAVGFEAAFGHKPHMRVRYMTHQACACFVWSEDLTCSGARAVMVCYRGGQGEQEGDQGIPPSPVGCPAAC